MAQNCPPFISIEHSHDPERLKQVIRLLMSKDCAKSPNDRALEAGQVGLSQCLNSIYSPWGSEAALCDKICKWTAFMYHHKLRFFPTLHVPLFFHGSYSLQTWISCKCFQNSYNTVLQTFIIDVLIGCMKSTCGIQKTLCRSICPDIVVLSTFTSKVLCISKAN